MLDKPILEKNGHMPHQDFTQLAEAWCNDQSEILIDIIWRAYDLLKHESPSINCKDLERNITQLLESRIHRVMTQNEPFYVQHGPYERETMQAPPAQPPQYDIAFVLLADEQIMGPMEAKVLETAGTVAEYIEDVKEEFLTCRYAPFSSEGAMLGYLLSGTSDDVFKNISAKVPCKLEDHPGFTARPQKMSHHVRTVPAGKPYPAVFRCHHLIFEFHGLKRSRE
jgi:hypothetical protein